ncbi:MAG: hypothetical protein M0002_18075 [Rhodospirillales bacterium]|nr:hypothetical protein [Rhodospirillales bacterium]
MAFHLSLISATHRASDVQRLREELTARAMEIWASPGVVAVAVLAEAGTCGLLTTWEDRASFLAWQQRLSCTRLQDFLARISETPPRSFDCAFHETDIAPPAGRPARPMGSVVPLRPPLS